MGLTILTGLYKLVRWLIEARRERRRGSREHPFVVIPPNGDVLAVALPDPLDSPLNDHRIPYLERIPGRSVRREMEDLLHHKGALLVCGKSGLGKTREAAHLAQMLNREGWTVLFLRPDAWLEPPARRLEGVPTHKLLLFLDDLSRQCASGRREINPRADSLAQPLVLPFQKRLLKTLEALEAFYGKGEILCWRPPAARRPRNRRANPPNEDAFAHGNLADLYVTLGRLKEARCEFEERIRLRPHNTFWPRVALGVLARHQGLPESDEHFRQALAQWDQAWQERLQSAAGLLENKALALLCLGRKDEALTTLKEALAQRGPGDEIELTYYELLRTAPAPPDGLEEMIALLKAPP